MSAQALAPGGPAADAPPLCRLGSWELASLYRRREVSPVEVTQAVLARAFEVNAKCNAFVHLDADGALRAARKSEARWGAGQPAGPLDGVPATIKNLVSVQGWPLRLGSLTTTDDPVAEDAPTALALRRSGAVIFGATTTCEFGWKGVADSPLSGVTRNPWNQSKTSGGSSGGAAVAAATGCGAVHLGSDGGGSIRIPASFSGVVGHKPSFGRVPYFPPSAFGTVGHLGPIARSAGDAALMLDVLSARDLRDWHQNPLRFAPLQLTLARARWKGMRIGLWTRPPTGEVDREVLDATLRVARAIERQGALIEPVDLPGEDLLEIFNVLWFTGAAHRVRRIPAAQLKLVDPALRAAAEVGAGYSAVQYADAAAKRAGFGIEMDWLLERYELLLSPATLAPAFDAGHDVPAGSGMKFWTEWAGFNFPLNLSQQPACSVPAGTTAEGLPIGVQLVGPKARDDVVLGAAGALAELVAGRAEPATMPEHSS